MRWCSWSVKERRTELGKGVVGVLLGGLSPEREVSLASGEAVAQALAEAGWSVRRYDHGLGPESDTSVAERLLTALTDGPFADVAVVFNALHGGAGEDGRIQALLELAGMPYTGTGPLGSALSMDKWLTKLLARSAGVGVPDGEVWERRDPTPVTTLAAAWGTRLGWPLVVKPVDQGSTVGFSLVEEAEDLATALEAAAVFGARVLVENFVPGREVTVAVVDGTALPVVEIVPSHGVYDYDCKYTPGLSSYHCPAELEAGTVRELQTAALTMFEQLLNRDYSRMDFRLDPQGRPFLLEANTLPGFTSTSLVPKAAAAAGISFPGLCDRLVTAAVARGTGR